MKSRERILKAINHEEPDRVPLFCQDIMPSFRKELLKYWGSDFKKDRKYVFYFLDFNHYKKLGFDSSWGFDGFPVRIPQNYLKNHPLPKLEDSNKYVDIDGRISMKNLSFESDISWYLTNYIKNEEMADFFYNTYFDIEWEESIDFAVKINKKLKRFPMDDFLFCAHLHPILEPIWEGLGLGLLIKLIRKQKSKIKRYIDLRTKIAVNASKLWAETDFEVFFLCDDSALKNTTMINPKYHKELIIPAYKQILHPIIKAGKYVIFHSDGFTEPYFDGLVEARFHGIEALEPMAGMDLKHLKEKYGDKVCLIGNIDVSQLLPFGTIKEVDEAVRSCIKNAGEGGGYILSPCTDITNSCKLDNIFAMISANKKYGKYPLKL
ncbi:MAG: uroporphyrinogen decarboxylase family protein [Candidatus Thorarchaeota archaeon]